eukprot:m51a1_g12432 hypothetical protein (231) ;mRNA; r:824827-825782
MEAASLRKLESVLEDIERQCASRPDLVDVALPQVEGLLRTLTFAAPGGLAPAVPPPPQQPAAAPAEALDSLAGGGGAVGGACAVGFGFLPPPADPPPLGGSCGSSEVRRWSVGACPPGFAAHATHTLLPKLEPVAGGPLTLSDGWATRTVMLTASQPGQAQPVRVQPAATMSVQGQPKPTAAALGALRVRRRTLSDVDYAQIALFQQQQEGRQLTLGETHRGFANKSENK